MKRLVFIFSLLSASAIAYAVDQPPKALRDKGQSSIQSPRSFSTHSPIGTGLAYSIECKGKLVDPYFGYLSDEQFFAKKIPINLVCYKWTDPIVGGGAISRNLTTGKWTKDVSKFIKSGGVDFTPEEIKQQEKAIHFYLLDNVNSQGYAYTIDDLIEKRTFGGVRFDIVSFTPPKQYVETETLATSKTAPKAT